MAKRYEIQDIKEATSKLSGHSLDIASVMDTELGTEPLSRRTIEGVIRIIADAQDFGKHVDIDKVFQDLISSGFLFEI